MGIIFKANLAKSIVAILTFSFLILNKRWSTIILSDMNGKGLFTKEVANDDYLFTDALLQGIYLVIINTGEGNIVKKLVKKYTAKRRIK